MTVLRLYGGLVSLRFRPRLIVTLAGLAAALLAVTVLSLALGDFPVPAADVLRALVGAGTPADRFVVVTLRLPRLLTAVLVGAALAASGSLFQSISRNPLGSPDVVGFTTGAATGALLVILVRHGSTAAAGLGAVAGGLATAVLVYALAYRRGVQRYRLVLVGIGVAAVLASANSYLLLRADLGDAQSAAVWLTGSLNGRGWEHVRPVGLALLVLLPLAGRLTRPLTVLELGDDLAHGLGARVQRVQLAAGLVGVALCSTAVAAAGPVAFVALAAPHVARRLAGSTGPSICATALTGALLLAVSDLAAQHVPGGDLPVGLMTGLVGGLYLGWLLAREWRRGR